MKLSNLFQSKEWEEFEKALGRKTFFVSDALFIRMPLPKGGCYLFCARGPEVLDAIFLEEAQKLGVKTGAIFIRIEPIKIENGLAKELNETLSINPPSTLILNLSKSEDILLSEMKQKARYNLNLAKKKGIEIEKTIDPEKVGIFYSIMNETTSRDGFSTHPIEHYKKQLELLGKKGFLKLYLAKFEGKYIAANLVSFYGNTVSYLHGASSNEYRNIMAPYLLQWEAIMDAKKAGYEYYDFWGIAPDDNPRHKWAGVTRFKKGFGGTQINYPGTFDLVISKPWYMIYKIVRFLNRLF